jgi:hypothetical protein
VRAERSGCMDVGFVDCGREGPLSELATEESLNNFFYAFHPVNYVKHFFQFASVQKLFLVISWWWL